MDGKLHAVTGNLASMMAGLCCGEVCTLGWDVIKHHASHFFSVDDSVAAFGMRLLGNPAKGDPAIISGESGAVTMGLVYRLMVDPELTGMKHALGLTAQSIVLCISTEGEYGPRELSEGRLGWHEPFLMTHNAVQHSMTG